jgi:hypothetical protein
MKVEHIDARDRETILFLLNIGDYNVELSRVFVSKGFIPSVLNPNLRFLTSSLSKLFLNNVSIVLQCKACAGCLHFDLSYALMHATSIAKYREV